MKKLLLTTILTFLLSSVTYGAADVATATDFVNQEISDVVGFINKGFVAKNITDCTAINTSRPSDTITFMDQLVWDSGVQVPGQTVILTFDYHNPVSAKGASKGLTKRIELLQQDGSLGAIVEFTCDMKKGYLAQTGKKVLTHQDLLEVYWDNTAGFRVDFMLIGPVDGNIFVQRDTTNGKPVFGTAGATVPTVSQALITAFLLDYDPTVASAASGTGTWVNDGSILVVQ